MKKAIISILVGVLKILVLALFCDLIYGWTDLSKVVGPCISYSQWVGIIVIINSITPNGIIDSNSKNDK